MTDTSNPLHSPVFGNAEFDTAIDKVLANASNTIRIFDHTLGSGYNTVARCGLLRKFLLSSRRNSLQIVLHDTQSLDRNCPRILQMLRTHSHAIAIHETHLSAKSVYDPFVVVDSCCFVHRFHFDEKRGLCAIDDPLGAQTFIERFGEIWEASSPAVFATTLGL